MMNTKTLRIPRKSRWEKKSSALTQKKKKIPRIVGSRGGLKAKKGKPKGWHYQKRRLREKGVGTRKRVKKILRHGKIEESIRCMKEETKNHR